MTATQDVGHGEKKTDDQNNMNRFIRSLFPPYYKYAVFLFVGFEFVYSACVLALSEAYYKSAATVLPIAYRMFDDTVAKNKEGFDWTPEEKSFLDWYKQKMLILWCTSTVGVLLCMIVIIPQFFDFNDKRGNPSHLCLVRKSLGWILFILVAIYVAALGIAVFSVWWDATAASEHFHHHFENAEKEESYIGELETAFECESDEDLEVAPEHMCYTRVEQSFISGFWKQLLLYLYLIGHVLAFLAIPIFNRQLIKRDDDETTLTSDNNKLLNGSS